MSAYWKEQLKNIIELTQENVQRLEAEETRTSNCALQRTEAARQKIEAEKKAIARLQHTIDALEIVRPQKIMFGEMREMGARDVIVCCSDYRCGHRVEMNADQWPDEVRLSEFEDRFVCAECGRRGAEARPKFPPG